MKVIATQNQSEINNHEEAVSSRASLFLLKYEFFIPLIIRYFSFGHTPGHFVGRTLHLASG
jgi:hypothetical protein